MRCVRLGVYFYLSLPFLTCLSLTSLSPDRAPPIVSFFLIRLVSSRRRWLLAWGLGLLPLVPESGEGGGVGVYSLQSFEGGSSPPPQFSCSSPLSLARGFFRRFLPPPFPFFLGCACSFLLGLPLGPLPGMVAPVGGG